MGPVEVLDNVIALTLRDERSAALELARKAVEFSPSRLEFEQSPGFSAYPGGNPAEAERRLLSMRGRRGAAEGLLTACLAICKIRRGLGKDAADELRRLSDEPDEHRFWRTADSLAEPEPVLQETSLPEWAASVVALFER